MKTITLDLKNHLRQEVTTLCSCLSISRTDGHSFFFTDHDQPILIDGQSYVPYNSFARTSISTTIEMEVDSMEVTGILNSGAVVRDDVNGGLFDYAAVEVFLVNYEAPVQGKLRLRRGWIGEISMNPDETFVAEIRGLTQVLAFRVGDAYSPMCRADLGDRFCKVALVPPRWAPIQTYKADDFITGIVATASNFVQPSVANPSFEDDPVNTLVNAPAGWTAYGDPDARWRIIGAYINDDVTLNAKVGSQFALQSRAALTRPTEAGMYQDFDLITAGVDADQLDTGLCRLFASIWTAGPGDNSNSRVRAYCYDANGGSLGSIWDTGVKRYSPDVWISLNANNALIPAGTRVLRIDLNGTMPTDTDTPDGGVAFDGLSIAINLPEGDFENHPQFGGRRFQCTVAGTTGTTEPLFTDTLGATYVDGTVTWTAVDTLEDTGTVITGDPGHQSFTFSGAGKTDGFFDLGLLTWETGQNAGRTMEVKTYLAGVVTFFQRTFYPIVADDRFVIRPGCDKRRITCHDVYNNVINFRGEPDVPGQDRYYATPNAAVESNA